MSGVSGNTAANGTWLITTTATNKFTLNGATGNGSYISGGAIGDGGYTFPSSTTAGLWTSINETQATGNVKRFGAKADNTTDDRNAIQACIDAVAAIGGGIVFLPAGVYKVTSQIRISGPSIQIFGAGRGGSVIQFAPTANATLFLFDKDADTLLYCGMNDIDIAAVADTTYTKIAVDLHDVRHFYARNVHIKSWTGPATPASIGFKIRGRDHIDLEKLHVEADYPIVVGKNDDGAGGYRDSNKDIDHWRVVNCALDTNNNDRLAVKFEDAVVLRNVTFRSNAFVNGGLGIVDANSPRRRSINLRMSDIRVEGIWLSARFDG